MANKNLYVHNGLTVGSSVEINGTSGNVLTSGIVTTTNTTNASSTITGALQVRGGAGIGGNLYVGGTIYGNVDATVSSATTIATTARTTNAAHYLTFVDSNNASATYEPVYTTSSFVINPSTSNVGIGTSSPGYGIDVQNANGGVLARFKDTDSTYTGIVIAGDTNAGWIGNSSIQAGEGIYYQSNTNWMRFFTTSTERMRITSVGDIGIGTGTPGDFGANFRNLEVYGTSGAQVRLNGNGVVDTVLNSNAVSSTAVVGTRSNHPLTFITSSTEAMRILSNNNVGIGTTTPDDPLDITGTNGLRISQSKTNNTQKTGRIRFQHYTNAEEPVTGINVVSRDTTSELKLGGGTSIENAVTDITFHTAANNTTTSGTQRMMIDSAGNVGIGTTSTTYKLEVNGSFAATTKSFVINHPTKPGMKLRYGSLEGPENGVYVRGRLKGSNKIELPDYWTGLVDEETITVNLTPIGKHQKLYVEDIADNIVIVGNDNLLNKEINCFYTVFAERKDVDKLDVEI